MEKQLSLLVLSLTDIESGGAILEVERTASYLRRAAGRGRFSGTMVSRGLFPCQEGHILFWLHLAAPPTKNTCSSSSIEFDMVTNMIFSSLPTASCSNVTELLSPIIEKHEATPITTHRLLQQVLFFSLYLHKTKNVTN